MSTLTLIIGNKNYSSWSLRPWLLLRYFNLSFEEKRIALFTDNTDQQLEPYFSNYKVPVLQHGDITIWDSLSIMEYVSENLLDGRGWPDEKHARAMARSMSAEMHSSFIALRDALPMNCRKHYPDFEISAEVQADVNRIIDLWTRSREHFALRGPWLFGEFSIADAMFAPVVLRFTGYEVETTGRVAEYVQTVLELPAMQEWIEGGKLETEVIEFDEV